jgi:catechol 2,3-dioxygenase-like lactoylglutathione lyase family enzyme
MDLKMTHTTIYVLNQESAHDFYVNKLGFEVKADISMGPAMRWLTVSPKGQPELEIILMPVIEGMLFSKESAKMMAKLIKDSTLGFGVIKCNDVYAAYEELRAKGVIFKKEPRQTPFGIEAVFCDDSGNWFSLQQINLKTN